MTSKSFDLDLLWKLVKSACSPVSDNVVEVDVHFFTVKVDKDVCDAERSVLVRILDNWPEVDQFGNEPGPLTNGLSYIAIGSAVGDQHTALMLLAVGQVMGFWKVVTPALLGVKGEEADRMAGGGFVMATGYQPTQEKDHV